MLGWFLFKQLRDEQGVDKLPPIDQPMENGLNIYAVPMSRLTYGTRINPTCIDPLTLAWRYLDQRLVPVLSQVAPAPVSAVLQLVRCNCQKSKCSRGCSCRGNYVVPEYANVAEKATTVRTLHLQ